MSINTKFRDDIVAAEIPKIVLPKKGRPPKNGEMTEEEKARKKREYSRKYYREHKEKIIENNKKCRERTRQLAATMRNIIATEGNMMTA